MNPGRPRAATRAPIRRSAATWIAVAAAADPARAAREVFQAPGFWWKRIERRPVSQSWFVSLVNAAVDYLATALRGLGDLLARLLRDLFGVVPWSSSGGAIAVWLIAAGLAAWSLFKLLPLVAVWLRGRPARPPRTREGADRQPLAEASDLFEQSQQAYRDGLYAESIRLAFLALIARLEKQGLIRRASTRTNREYLNDLRRRADVAAPFAQAARIYERIWYGRAAAGRAEAEQAIHLCGSVINKKDLAPE